MTVFKPLLFAFVVVSVLGASPSVLADSDREAKQAELDAACEAARQQKLVPMRQTLVQECIAEKEFETEAECEAYYSDFGARTGGRRGGRAPLFYDLPECVEAFEYQNSERSGG